MSHLDEHAVAVRRPNAILLICHKGGTLLDRNVIGNKVSSLWAGIKMLTFTCLIKAKVQNVAFNWQTYGLKEKSDSPGFPGTRSSHHLWTLYPNTNEAGSMSFQTQVKEYNFQTR